MRRRIKVAESLAEIGGELHFGPPKSHAERLVPLTATLAEAFSRRLDELDADPAALVFPSPRGAPLRYSNFRSTVWLPALERLGLGETIFDEAGRRRGFRPAFGFMRSDTPRRRR